MYSMIVTLTDEQNQYIGSIEVPTVNGKHIYVDDFQGQRGVNGQPINIHDALDDLWVEWRHEVKCTGTDIEFIDWLVKIGWKIPRLTTIVHVVHPAKS